MLTKLLTVLVPLAIFAESPFLNMRKNTTQNESAESPKPVSARHKARPELLREPGAGGRFKTDLTFLIWQAQEDGLEFAAPNNPQLPLLASVPTDISASLESVDFSWEPAFKALLGYHFAVPAWDINARWTWYHSRSSKSLSDELSGAGAGLLPLWIPPQAAIATFPVYSDAKGTLQLLLNNVDLELAYAGGVSSSFFLKVHGGLKIVSIQQQFRVKYSGGFFDGTNRMLESRAAAKVSCLGGGPRVGFGAKWAMPGGWSLITEAAGAFALSNMETKRKDNSIGTASGASQQLGLQFKESFWVWRPLLEGKAGLRWETCFGSQNQRTFNVELDYEIQEYWEQNMLARYTDSAIFFAAYNNRGNLTLQGFSLTVALGY